MNVSSRVLIIIPAYNEAASLAHVIDSIRASAPWADIAVVNDGSRDATPRIARAKSVILLNLPYNLGIGGAVQTGYKFAAEFGYDIAVQVDGDGQHPAEEIPKLIDAIRDDEADMIIGSRYIENAREEQSLSRGLGKWILATAISLLAGQRMTDISSGFRAANRNVIHLLAHMYPRDYPEPESVALLLHERFRIKEVPVRMKQRYAGESSITLLNGVYYVIKVMLATIIDLYEGRVSLEEYEAP